MVELPTVVNEGKGQYCMATLREWRQSLSEASNRTDTPEEDGEEDGNVGPLQGSECLRLLDDILQGSERGTKVWLDGTQHDVDKRWFVVIDGNHRLAALQKTNPDQVVRAAVLPKSDVADLLSTGTLLNFIRGIQAVDTTHDRVVWIREYHKYDF